MLKKGRRIRRRPTWVTPPPPPAAAATIDRAARSRTAEAAAVLLYSLKKAKRERVKNILRTSYSYWGKKREGEIDRLRKREREREKPPSAAEEKKRKNPLSFDERQIGDKVV